MRTLNLNKLLSAIAFLSIGSFGMAQESNDKPFDYYELCVDSGVVQKNNENYDKAILIFKKAISMDSNRYVAKFELGWTYRERARTRENTANHAGALSDYDSAIFYSNPDYLLFLNRANVKFKLKDFDGAMIDYNSAIKYGRDEPYIYVKRGELKHDLKDYEGAIEDFTKEIELNPTYWIPYSDRAFSKRELELFESAIDDYSMAIELYPDPPYDPYIACRARLYFEVGNFDAAISDFTSIVYGTSFHRHNHEMFIPLGKAQVKVDDLEGAIQTFTNDIDLHPNYGETYFERGKVYLLMNNIEAACADFQKAIALHFQFDREVIPKQCK